MISILNQIFEDKGFSCDINFMNQEREEKKEEKFQDKDSFHKEEVKIQEREETKKAILKRVYINSYDEMYLIVEGELRGDILTDILEICAEIEEDSEIKKSYKSNWGLILLTNISGELSWEQKKKVLYIEENKYFCRKYVLWYSNEEKEELEKLCCGNYTLKNINSIIENYSYFCEFKKSGNKAYEFLSRIFIKLPYMSLNSLETTDKTISDFVKKKLDDIHPDLVGNLEMGDVNSIKELVILSDRERKEIDKRIELLTKGKS